MALQNLPASFSPTAMQPENVSPKSVAIALNPQGGVFSERQVIASLRVVKAFYYNADKVKALPTDRLVQVFDAFQRQALKLRAGKLVCPMPYLAGTPEYERLSKNWQTLKSLTYATVAGMNEILEAKRGKAKREAQQPTAEMAVVG
jgi:hypothetical protein